MRTNYDSERLKRGALREGLSYVAHAGLYGLGYLPSRHRPKRSADLRTLVFVHGLGATRGSLFPLQAYLRFHGYSRQLSFNYRGPSIEAMAINLKERLAREVQGGRIDLICHSMGGLVARYYLQMLGGNRRVDRLITLATPHHGTHPSAYIPARLFGQFKPRGEFIDHLNEQPEPSGVETWSFAAGEDLIVLPPESGLAPFGHGQTFDRLGHLSILLSPEAFAAVGEALKSPTLNEPSVKSLQ